MKTAQDLPTPRDLWAAPQLAILAVLEFTLEMVSCALLAQHPDIFDHEKPYWIKTDLSTPMAEQILSGIGSLRRSIDGYRCMLATELEDAPNPHDDFPF